MTHITIPPLPCFTDLLGLVLYLPVHHLLSSLDVFPEVSADLSLVTILFLERRVFQGPDI